MSCETQHKLRQFCSESGTDTQHSRLKIPELLIPFVGFKDGLTKPETAVLDGDLPSKIRVSPFMAHRNVK